MHLGLFPSYVKGMLTKICLNFCNVKKLLTLD